MGGLTCRYPLEWLSPSFQNHSNHSLSFKATSQSTHHPLQRMMGGLTFWKRKLASVRSPCFECFEWWNATRMMGWHWNDGMTMEWAHPWLILHSWIIPVILSLKSGHPTPSSERVGWTDFSLPIRISSQTFHSWIIPSSMNHSRHSGGWVARLDTYFHPCVIQVISGSSDHSFH